MGSTSSSLELRMAQVGPWPMNTYALVCQASGKSVLFDPGADPDALLELLKGSEPVAILLTHTHRDHVGVLEEMRTRLKVPVYAYAGESHNPNSLRVEVDHTLNDGDLFQVGEHAIRAIHTPGHTRDMLTYYPENDTRAIVGDTIFEGGPGKTWSHEDFEITLATLRSIVLAWPDETVCYPGHGPAFRLGDKRAAIEAFSAREHGDFYGDAEWGM